MKKLFVIIAILSLTFLVSCKEDKAKFHLIKSNVDLVLSTEAGLIINKDFGAYAIGDTVVLYKSKLTQNRWVTYSSVHIDLPCFGKDTVINSNSVYLSPEYEVVAIFKGPL